MLLPTCCGLTEVGAERRPKNAAAAWAAAAQGAAAAAEIPGFLWGRSGENHRPRRPPVRRTAAGGRPGRWRVNIAPRPRAAETAAGGRSARRRWAAARRRRRGLTNRPPTNRPRALWSPSSATAPRARPQMGGVHSASAFQLLRSAAGRHRAARRPRAL